MNEYTEEELKEFEIQFREEQRKFPEEDYDDYYDLDYDNYYDVFPPGILFN